MGILRARNGLPLTQEKLEALLKWLDPDCEAAGLKYIAIQKGLIRMSAAKGLSDAEGVADAVINIVADLLPRVGPDYKGDPANYFRGVARYVILEPRWRKEVATDPLPDRPVKVTDTSDEYECLLKCLKFFPSEKRELVLDYHVYEGGAKIANHQEMADELEISVNALRVRAHRARAELEKCVQGCVETLRGNENRPENH